MNVAETLKEIDRLIEIGGVNDARSLCESVVKYFIVDCINADDCNLITKSQAIINWMDEEFDRLDKVHRVILHVMRFGEPGLIEENLWLRTISPWADDVKGLSVVDLVRNMFYRHGDGARLHGAIWIELFKNENNDYFKKWSQLMISNDINLPQSVMFADNLMSSKIKSKTVFEYIEECVEMDFGCWKYFLHSIVTCGRVDVLNEIFSRQFFKEFVDKMTLPIESFLTPSGKRLILEKDLPRWMMGKEIFDTRYPMVMGKLNLGGVPSDEVIYIAVKNISSFQSVEEFSYMSDYANITSDEIAPTLLKLINLLEVEFLKNSIGQKDASNIAKAVAL